MPAAGIDNVEPGLRSQLGGGAWEREDAAGRALSDEGLSALAVELCQTLCGAAAG